LIAILGVEDEEGSSFEGDILYVVVGCGVEGLKELNVFGGGSFYYRFASYLIGEFVEFHFSFSLRSKATIYFLANFPCT
jgi:hypothetical protein